MNMIMSSYSSRATILPCSTGAATLAARTRVGAIPTIAIDLLTANATSTAPKIDGLLLLRNGRRRRQRQPDCAAVVKARKYGDATSSLEASASTAEECEAEFVKRRVVSPPLMAEGENAFRLAKLGVPLLRYTF